jgi:ubiquitin conjugation factor E4 A
MHVQASIVTWTPKFVPLETNPFSRLFSSKDEAAKRVKLTTKAYQDNLIAVSNAIEDTTLLTLDKSSNSSLVFLPTLAAANRGQTWLDLDLLDAAFFQRLLYKSIKTVGKFEQQASEPSLVYLFQCYLRARKQLAKEKNEFKILILTHIEATIMRNTLTTLFGDDRYETESFGSQIDKILKSEDRTQFLDFLESGIERMYSEGNSMNTIAAVKTMFDDLHKEIEDWTLANTILHCETLELLTQITSKKHLGQQLLNHSFPVDRTNGKAWENTILGSLLSISVINKKGKRPEFFTANAASMLISEYKINEQNAFCNADILFGYIFQMWENLFRGNIWPKHAALEWIGQCLQANKGRSGELANQGGASHLHSSTAFFINLEKLLLEFCIRFMKDSEFSKLMKVSAKYFKQKKEDVKGCEKMGLGNYLEGFSSETTLVELKEEETESESSYDDKKSLLDNIFFMSHVSLDLGMNQALKEIRKIEEEMRNIRDCEKALKSSMGKKEVFLDTTLMTENGLITYRKIVWDEEELKIIKNEIYTRHSCFRTAMMNPKARETMNTFVNGSTIWLLKQCGVPSLEVSGDSVSLEYLSEAPTNLAYIPEFMFENIYSFLNLENTAPVYGKAKMKIFSGGIQANILKLLTVFMQTNWVKNPHLRARVAKALSLLLPEVANREDLYRSAALLQPSVDSPLLQPQAVEEADNLFRNISCKTELVEAIMKVYVSLEVAGEALQFEQKFNYRFPINFVLFYLLKIDAYREIIFKIALNAHKNMTNQQPPIFLKFVNGMINDGTWLLDEALNNMMKIRKVEDEIASPQWKAVSDEVKEQKLADLKRSKEVTRNMNVLSNDVIRMLEALAKLTTQVFTHPDMADRISAMMNYFMDRLTGKNRKQYKVKDPNDLLFDPLKLLKSLNHIYCSFSTEQNFVIAISQDGRSYRPDLFDEALKILRRYEDVTDLEILAERVKEEADGAVQSDNLSVKAPEDFLDPIMSTLMKEPVILPSSGKVVDRSTIAKHLLSDETDPFNRQPLTLDMVQHHHALKEKINKWIKSETQESDQNIEKDLNDIPSTNTAESASLFSGGHSIAGNKLLPRIRKDLAEIYRENIDGILVVPEDKDMTKIHVLIAGPEETPYFGGFFYFIIQCPPSYPAAPPKVLFLTTDGGRVRFNPNLYRNGRVCLSVLGTTSGPGWTPALSLLSVLLTIRSILNAQPYHNIPETELEKTPGDSERYNTIIKHETIRVALIQTLYSPPREMPDVFLDEIRNKTKSNLPQIMRTLKLFENLSGKEMKNDWLEIRAVFQWNNLEEDMKKLAEKLGVETNLTHPDGATSQDLEYEAPKNKTKYEYETVSSEKINKACEATRKATSGGHSVGGGRLLPRIRKDLTEIMNEAPEGMYVVPDEVDMTKIHAIITGPKDTPYEGGFFYFIIQCPPNYPASPPKATLVTTDLGRVRFNPNLYRNGKVCLSILGTWSGPGWSPALSLLSVLISIQTLLNEKPFYNEPGFEESAGLEQKSEMYNQIIRHETTRVAYLGMIKNPPSEMPIELEQKIFEAAPSFRQHHLSICTAHSHIIGQEMMDPMNENRGVFRWDKLTKELESNFTKKKNADTVSKKKPDYLFSYLN